MGGRQSKGRGPTDAAPAAPLASPDPEDHVFWDFAFVLPKKSKLLEEKRKRDVVWEFFKAVDAKLFRARAEEEVGRDADRGDDAADFATFVAGEDVTKKPRREKYDAFFIARRLEGAGLRYACYESIQGDEVIVRVGATARRPRHIEEIFFCRPREAPPRPARTRQARRLAEQADTIDFKVELDPARTRAAAEAGFRDLGFPPASFFRA